MLDFMRLDCEDFRDKVFGLQGLVEESQRIPIHYSKTATQVFTSVLPLIIGARNGNLHRHLLEQFVSDRERVIHYADIIRTVARYYDYDQKKRLDLWLKTFERYLEGKVSGEVLDKETMRYWWRDLNPSYGIE